MMPAARENIEARVFTAAAIIWAAVVFLSLRFHFLDPLIPTTWHGRMGFDFFAVPRAFINLRHGVSIYATRACAYGPYSTWYPYHPALALLAGSWLSLFPPWGAFWVFAAASVAALALCARLLGGLCPDSSSRGFLYFLFLFPLPVYLMIWNGQMHVFLVAAFALMLYDLLLQTRGDVKDGLRPWLLAGILLSLFSKPLVLLALPALAAVKACRKTLLWALLTYALVSVLFIIVPALNPQGIGIAALLDVAAHPDRMFRFQTYNGVRLMTYRPEVLGDNAIHWLNMRFRSQVSQPQHFELMALPSFVEDIFGVALPGFLLKLPALLILGLSVALLRITDAAARAKGAIYVVALTGLAFFVSYQTVYEYHYAMLLPGIASLVILFNAEKDAVSLPLIKCYCAAGAMLLVPTSYYFLSNRAYGFHRAITATMNDVYVAVFTGGHIYDWALPLMRLNRVLPAALMFVLAFALGCRLVLREGE
jgi:hypothetical protein